MSTTNPHERSAILATQRGFDLAPLYEIEPGLCSMALFIPFEESATQPAPILVDERRIYIGPRFARVYDSQEQAFLVAHNVLHFALGHPSRRRQVVDEAATLRAQQIWAVASDAIVNDALSHVKTLTPPSGEISMDDIVRIVPTARMLSLEQLYEALSALADKAAGTLAGLIEQLGKNHRLDVIASGTALDVGEAATTPEEWRERIKRGFGRNAGGFNRVLGHLPRTETRWEHILRSAVAQAIGDATYTDPSRPHRRWIAMQRPMRAKGIVLPVIPGVLPKPKARIAVAIDTSGSIDIALLTLFMAEIAAIMRQQSAGCRVITSDAAVHQVQDFQRPQELVGFVPAGGGGTDFDPAITAAAEYRPSVLIYFTDLIAPTPLKPKFPVIWAVPKTADIPSHPYGRRIDIKRRQ
jgi:predicted metal-dependent peptidase